jgi:hypothetical protein
MKNKKKTEFFSFRLNIKEMFILSDLYRVAINVGDRALTPGIKKVCLIEGENKLYLIEF